jgi:hypothetical protein
MCEQCMAETKCYGEVMPHWWLVQATKEGWMMKPGDFGLVYINDPDFVWSPDFMPMIDPTFDLTDEQQDVMTEEQNKEWDVFYDRVTEIEKHFDCEPTTGYNLVSAAKEAGYDEDKHGWRFLAWLTHQMALVMQSNPMADEKIANELDKEREMKWGYYHDENGVMHKNAKIVEV